MTNKIIVWAFFSFWFLLGVGLAARATLMGG